MVYMRRTPSSKNLVEIGVMFLYREEDLLNFFNVFSLFSYLSPLGKGQGSSFQQT